MEKKVIPLLLTISLVCLSLSSTQELVPLDLFKDIIDVVAVSGLEDCEPNPCQHGGTCRIDSTLGSRVCDCFQGYSGEDCQVDQCGVLDNCNAQQEHGYCSVPSDGSAVSCVCFQGYSGTKCQIKDVCVVDNPCVSGTCVNNGECECDTSVSGKKIKFGDRCQFVNPCFSDPCQNGGTCTPDVVNNNPTFTCECVGGLFTGDLCENPELVDLYPYLSSATVISFDDKDNGNFEVDLSQPFRVFCSEANSIFINVNGYVSLDESFDRNSFTRNRFIRPSGNRYFAILSPFWVDAEAEAPNNAYGQVYYKQYTISDTENDDVAKHIFALAKYDLADSGVDPTFNPDWIMIITWDKMRNLPLITQGNTFQLVMVQDSVSEKSYALFFFGDLSWKFNSLARSFEVVSGVRGVAPNVRNSYRSISFVGRRSAFYSLDFFDGNFPDKRPGRYYFKISTEPTDTCLAPITPESQCFSWAARQRLWNLNSIRTRITFLNLMPCPCSERVLIGTGRFKFWGVTSQRPLNYYDSSFERCYTSRRVRGGSEGVACCYTVIGRISILNPRKSVFLTSNPNLKRKPQYYQNFARNDYLGYDYCCRKSGLCNVFLQHRSFRFCTPSPVRMTFFWGDPHITTLDEKGYSFNGLGEYMLMSYGTKTVTEFELQGRTGRALDKDGKPSLATVFTAVTAVDITGNLAAFVGLKSGTDDKMELKIRVESNNWVDKTSEIENADPGTDIDTGSDFLVLEKQNSSEIVINFPDKGVKLTVSAALAQLTLTTSVPNSWNANGDKKTRGLYGNYDGNADNDFEKPDGTVLDKDSSEAQIYSEFGEAWKLNLKSSRMYYEDGKDTNTFIDTTFRPIFVDEFPAEKIKEAQDKCGGKDKLSCIYDFLATGKDDVAAAAKAAAESSAEQTKVNNNNPPNITIVSGLEDRGAGVIFWRITKNQDAEAEFSVTDADGDNTASLKVENLPNGAVLSGSKIKWTNPDTTDILLAIKAYAEDDVGATSESLEIQIRYCDCKNNAVCNFEKPATGTNKTANYMRAFCKCDLGWSGPFCETDFEGCADPSPCPVNCTDKAAAEHKSTKRAYTCVGCPTGLQMNSDATKCLDIDECQNNPCGNNSRCDNTEGSYECVCQNGFEKDSGNPNNCNDIDECSKGLDDCPSICENTVGNFTCKCPDGYEDKTGDGKNCKIEASLETKCDAKNPKCDSSSQCQYVSGSTTTVECVCDNKHKLENGISCVDLNECENNSTNACDKSNSVCNNTDGGYICSCKAGYKHETGSQTKCEECFPGTWGVDCNNTCNCKVGSECKVDTGCVECELGYGPIPFCNKDIDECEEIKGRCGDNGSCNNLKGTFKCLCNKGYMWPGSNATCTDIDECQDSKLNQCQFKELCENTNGTYKCNCPEGSRLNNDNISCSDINECASNPCRNGGDCQNNINSFACECKGNFYGTRCEKEFIERFFPIEFLLKIPYKDDNAETKQSVVSLVSKFFKDKFGVNFTGIANPVMNELNKQSKFEGRFKVLHPDNVTVLVNSSNVLREFFNFFQNRKIGNYSYALNSVKIEAATTVSFEGSFVISSMEYSSDFENPLNATSQALEQKITTALTPFYTNFFGASNYLGVDAFAYSNYTETGNLKARYAIVLEKPTNFKDLLDAFNATVLEGKDTIKGSDLKIIRKTLFQGADIQLVFEFIDVSFILTNEKYNDGHSDSTNSIYKTLRESIKINIEPRYKESIPSVYDTLGDVKFTEATSQNILVKFPVNLEPEQAKPSMRDILIEFIKSSTRQDTLRLIKDLQLITSSISHDGKVFTTALCEMKTDTDYKSTMADVEHADSKQIINKIKGAVSSFYTNYFPNNEYLGLFNWNLTESSSKTFVTYEVGVGKQLIDGNDLVNKFYETVMNSSTKLGSTDINIEKDSLRQEDKLPVPLATYDAELILTSTTWDSKLATTSNQEYTNLKSALETTLKPQYEHSDALGTELFKEFSDWVFTEEANSNTKASFKVVAKDGKTIDYNTITKVLRHFLKTSVKVSRTERKFDTHQFETLSFKQNGRSGQVTIGEFVIYSSNFTSELSDTGSSEYAGLKNNLTSAVTPFYSSNYGSKYLDSFNWKFVDDNKDIKVSYEISFLLDIIPNDFVTNFDTNILAGGENIKNTNHFVTRRSVIQDIQLPLPPAPFWTMSFIFHSADDSNDAKNKLESFFKTLTILKDKFDKIDAFTISNENDGTKKASFKGMIYQGKDLPTLDKLYTEIILGSSRTSYDERGLGTVNIKPETLEIKDKDGNQPTLSSFFVTFVLSTVTYTSNYDNSESADYKKLKTDITDALKSYYTNTLSLQNVDMVLYSVKNESTKVRVSLEVYHTKKTVTVTGFDQDVLSNGETIKNTNYKIIRSTVYHNGFLPKQDITFAATINLDWKDNYGVSSSSEYTNLINSLSNELKTEFTKATILGEDFIKIDNFKFTKVSKSKTGVSGTITHSANALPTMYSILDKLVEHTNKEKNRFIFGTHQLLMNSIELNGTKIETVPSIVTFFYTYDPVMVDLTSPAAKNVSKKIIDNLTPFYTNLYGNKFIGLIVLALFPGSVQASTLVTLSREPLNSTEQNTLFDNLKDHATSNSEMDQSRVSAGQKSTENIGNVTLVTLYLKDYSSPLTITQKSNLKSEFKSAVPKMLGDNGITVSSVNIQTIGFKSPQVFVTLEVRSISSTNSDIEKVFKESDSIGSYKYQNDKIDTREDYTVDQRILFEGHLEYSWDENLLDSNSVKYVELKNELTQEFETAFGQQGVFGKNYTTAIEFKFENSLAENKTIVKATIIHDFKTFLPDLHTILHNLFQKLQVVDFKAKFGSKLFHLRSIALGGKTLNFVPSIVTFNYEYLSQMSNLESTEAKNVITKIDNDLKPFYSQKFPNSPSKIYILKLHRGSVIASNLVTLARSSLSDAEREKIFEDLVDYSKNNSNIDQNRIAVNGYKTGSFGSVFVLTLNVTGKKDDTPFSKTPDEKNLLQKHINQELHNLLHENDFMIISVESEELISDGDRYLYKVKIHGIGVNPEEVKEFIFNYDAIHNYRINSKSTKIEKIQEESSNKVIYIVVGVVGALIVVIGIAIGVLCFFRRKIESRDGDILSSDQQSSAYEGYNYPRPNRRHWMDTDSSLGSNSEIGSSAMIPRPKIGRPEPQVEQQVDWNALRRQTKFPPPSKKSSDAKLPEQGPTGWSWQPRY